MRTVNCYLELNLSKGMLLTIVIVCASTSLNDCDGSYAYLDTNELYRRADTVVKGTVTDVSTSEDVRHYYLTGYNRSGEVHQEPTGVQDCHRPKFGAEDG